MPSNTDDEMKEILDGVVEKLAAVEHERWSHWQSYVHDQGVILDDGSLLIPSDLVARWQGQIDRAYEDLSELEKESDREQVKRYLPIIVEALKGGRGNVGDA